MEPMPKVSLEIVRNVRSLELRLPSRFGAE